MRELKFRVWNIIEGGMFDPFEVRDFSLQTWTKRPDNFSVMQFTGLQDKNGKEIYEGDIVAEWRDRHRQEGAVFIVEYYKTGFRGVSKDSDRYGPFTKNLYVNNDNPILEIIGNIYQNPELIKK